VTGTARASASQPFGRVLGAIDRLGQHTAPTGAYRLALQVIFLRQMWESAGLPAAGTGSLSQVPSREPHWAVLVGEAADHADRGRPGVRTTEHVLEDVWRRAGTVRFLGLGPRDAVETPRLSGQADRLLADLVGAVAAADCIDGMFGACLDRYSRKLGSGGNYYTPRSISRLMAGVAAPRPGERILDPACGSAGLLIEAARFARRRAAGLGGLELHGRDIDAEVREVAAMNLVLNSLDGDLATGPVDSLRTGVTGLGCDVVLANPPFNMADWGYDELRNDDARWIYGTPPAGQANFAWVQHIIGELSIRGRAVVLLSDGAAKGARVGERTIRQHLVEADVIAGIVSLPAGLFPHTRIPACLWLLSKDKGAHPAWGRIPRRGQVLFVDARRSGQRTGRVPGQLSDEDADRVCRTVYAWRGDDTVGDADVFADEPGWCRSVHRDEIAETGYDLTPARYMRIGLAHGTQSVTGRGGCPPLEELYKCFAEAARLDRQLRSVLEET
jgi:type I restriction enzyme M protein